ncbi:unnamed protein product, partial [Cuscuta europaea]
MFQVVRYEKPGKSSFFSFSYTVLNCYLRYTLRTCYSKQMYQRTYSHTLQPINGEMFWPTTEHEEIQASIPKKMSGRPKKKRMCGESEPLSATQLSRKGIVMSCTIGKENGHNMLRCPKNIAPTPTTTGRGRGNGRGRGRGRQTGSTIDAPIGGEVGVGMAR